MGRSPGGRTSIRGPASSPVIGPEMAIDTARQREMTRATSAERNATTPARAPSVVPRRPGPSNVLILAGWCGLAGGLLEVGARVLCRWIDPTNRLYQVSRHFVWSAPLTYLLLFLG